MIAPLKTVTFLLLLGSYSCSWSAKNGAETLTTLTGKYHATDKNKAPITLEWHKAEDYETIFALGKHYLPILAEAFADDVRDVLDDNLKIKQEYAQAIGKIPPAEREKLVF